MNIACELSYRMDAEKWFEMTKEDAMMWPFVNALKRLSDMGHTCMMFVASNKDMLELDPSTGVHFKLSYPFHSHKESIQAFKPDVFISLTSPRLAERDAGFISSTARIKILRICAEACKHLCRESLRAYNAATVVVPSLDYEVPILQKAGVTAQMVEMENAVNKAWIKTLVQPKQYDFAGSCWSELKGFPLIQEVLNRLEQKGYKIHPWRNLNSLSRTVYMTELSKTRYLFHPSISEGSCRTVPEAIYCGTIPIVSTDSQNVCRQLHETYHHEVRTWGWANTVENQVSYFRPPQELADEIDRLVQSDEGKNIELSISDKYDSSVEVERWLQLISQLTP